MLMIKERLLSAGLAYKRLTDLSLLDGSAHSYATSVSYLAVTIWAYEELVNGGNWFRRLLGLAFVILLIVRVAYALHA
jgi:hypothetical protein